MARFAPILALISGLVGFSVGSPVVDARATGAADPLSPAAIINALGVGLVKDINAFVTVRTTYYMRYSRKTELSFHCPV